MTATTQSYDGEPEISEPETTEPETDESETDETQAPVVREPMALKIPIAGVLAVVVELMMALASHGSTRFRISTSGAPERRGIVQRLDVGTSGLMVVAKSEPAYTALKRAFRNREVSKVYHTLVQGHPDPFTGTIDAPIARHPGHDWKMAVVDGGRHSVTHYDTLEAFRAGTLLEVQLETGRTHQIRVHMAAIEHPCVGDPLYGSDPNLAARLGLERQWLHAVELGFTHPGTGEWVVFESGYPEDLAHALRRVADPAD